MRHPGATSRFANRRRAVALALMVASGFAGLGQQIVWTQRSALWLGHESAAVLAVVTAVFGGLAIGAALLGRAIERSHDPVRWYAACEVAIGLWGLVLVAGMAPWSGRVVLWAGPTPSAAGQWATAFVATFAMLLPATAAMGATLPAIERLATRPDGRSIAGLYAANTFGGMLGVLGTALWLVPAIGLARTAALCAALNLLCALAAPALRDGGRADGAAAGETAGDAASPRREVLALFAATGLLGIGYEVLVVRVLAEVSEDTVYTFALLLAVYLIGSASGAATFARFGRAGVAARGTDRLLVVQAVACLASSVPLWFAEAIHDRIAAAFGAGMTGALAAEAGVALVAFALPTFVMGALFGQLAARAGPGFGRALACNIAGAAIAPILFGVVLLPWLGVGRALLLVPLGYLVSIVVRRRERPLAWLTIVGGLVAVVAAPPLAFVDVPDGGRVVSYREGTMAAVSVVADADDVLRLRIDNRAQEGSSATRLVDGRQALLPLLLHPSPHRALFLGLGTGVTASTAAAEPSVDVDAVELLPEVIEAAERFVATDHPRLHVVRADARRFVRSTPKRYDVVVADNFHPARAGSGSLYTVEHFAAVRATLEADGLFCQWLPLHQLDAATLRSIVASFLAVFPDAHALLASNSLATPVLGLVGGRVPLRHDPDAVGRRLAEAAPRLSPFAIEDPFALLGSFVAGPQALRAYAARAPRNTDDRPVVAYLAPRATYETQAAPLQRLLALLRVVSVAPGEVLSGRTPPAFAERLSAYRSARIAYLEAGGRVQPSADVGTMLARVREPLLAVLRISPDFRPAYDPLVRMGRALAATDPEAAARLTDDIARARGERRD